MLTVSPSLLLLPPPFPTCVPCPFCSSCVHGLPRLGDSGRCPPCPPCWAPRSPSRCPMSGATWPSSLETQPPLLRAALTACPSLGTLSGNRVPHTQKSKSGPLFHAVHSNQLHAVEDSPVGAGGAQTGPRRRAVCCNLLFCLKTIQPPAALCHCNVEACVVIACSDP